MRMFCLLVLSLTCSAWSADKTEVEKPKPDASTKKEQAEAKVYVTPKGEKYHRVNCRYVKKKLTSAKSYPLKEAQRHYTACSVCKPDAAEKTDAPADEDAAEF